MPPAELLFTRDALSAGDLIRVRFPSGRYLGGDKHQWDAAADYRARYREKSLRPQAIINAGIRALRRGAGFV